MDLPPNWTSSCVVPRLKRISPVATWTGRAFSFLMCVGCTSELDTTDIEAPLSMIVLNSWPSQPTYSPIEDETSNNPKKRKVNLFKTLALGLGAKVNGQEVETIIDSGASMSVVSDSLVHPTHIKKENALPVQVETGDSFQPWNHTNRSPIGWKIHLPQCTGVTNECLPSCAWIGFSVHPPCQGVLTSPEPCRLLYDHK